MVNHTAHKPAEAILVHQPIGLTYLGAKFNAEAPFAACRLCGSLYQSDLDRKQYDLWANNDGFPKDFFTFIKFDSQLWIKYKELEHNAYQRRMKWRVLHAKRYHSEQEINAFSQLSWAFTPEAANVLTSYGIFPTGNMSREIVDAMATASRVPLNDAEGGE